MNFNFSEDQVAIRTSVQRMFIDLCSDDVIKALSKQAVGTHIQLWEQLAAAGIFSLPFRQEYGGMGLSMVELCQVIEMQGRFVAPIPLIPTVVEAGLTIAESNNDVVKQSVLPRVVAGEMLLSPVHAYQGLQKHEPLRVEVSNGVLLLNGLSGFVAYADQANGFVVAVDHFLLYCAADTEGLTVTPQTAMSNEPAGFLEFNQAKIEQAYILAEGDEARALIDLQKQRAWVALAALQVGVLDEGLKRTAAYVSERQQFGRALGTFQAVSQQAADAYMEIESLRSVYWRALQDMQSGNDFSVSAGVAKYWVAEAGHKAAHVVLHLHGGIGQDLDYPIHRYFLFAKQCERYLGSTSEISAMIGNKIMCSEPEQLAQLCL